ncbi:MAG: cyclopropane fatty acyl phospholipid synthase [Candidatus Uhrbacteria bacterium]|nr:cyclopropane fatty acyl phospholipid synthase [Candidatus Uhrbacteria bacterium]
MSSKTQSQIQTLLLGTGITMNGNNPWDIHVLNERFYNRVLSQGSLGLGESYMDGWWECAAIDEFITRIFSIDVQSRLRKNRKEIALLLASSLLNRQSQKRAFEVGEVHYDVGNKLYEAMLDKRMVYTCGYWPNASDLDSAQEAKLDLVCRKIGLKAGDRVLDIGCGWGSFAKFAAEKYGAHVVGITISQEQLALAQKSCEGLDVELRYQDYREVDEKFDHIVSLGMFEHVGYKNYRDYMRVANRCLKDDGLFLLHTIGATQSVTSTDPWIEKYIFPNSMLPSLAQITKTVEPLFIIEDIHNFSADYDTTLMHWFANFENAWPLLKDQYSERFYRMWKFYLLTCAASFRSRRNQLWQIVLSKKGVVGGYQSIR